VKDIDISMLFLNAGWSKLSKFENLSNQEVESIVTLNAKHPLYLSKVLLTQMLLRKQKSAIVVTSSISGSRPFPGLACYSASKSLSSYFAEGLSHEMIDTTDPSRPNFIDVLSWQLGETSTKLAKRKAGGIVVEIKEAVSGALPSLGREKVTWGCLKHDLVMNLISNLPDRVVLAFLKSKMRQVE